MRKILVLGWCVLSAIAALSQQSKPLTLIGKVVDSNAGPVGGAEVAIYEELYDYSMGQEYAQLLDRIKRTDANGSFVLNATIGSRYGVYVVARKEGLALGWDVLTQGARDKDDSTVIILERPCISAGIVVDQAGNPVARARVRAVPKTSYLRRLEQSPILAPEQWLVTQTDDKGNFRFDDFAADVSADFWVEAPGWSSVYQYTTHWVSSCGFEAGRTDIRLVLPKEVPVRGTVIDAESGKPVEGAHVVTRPDNIKEHANPYCPSQTISEQDGQFRFKGVPPGKHHINVSVPPQRMELVDKRVKLDVQADEHLKGTTVALDKGGLIEIIAREGGTNKPIGNLPIYFWQAIQDEHSTFYKDAATGRDGVLRICAPPGECKFSARCDGYLPETYDNQVLVAKGQTANLEIVLDNYPGVSGLVLDETGQPASGVLVKALPLGQEALTDQAGRFEVGFDPSNPCERLFARYIERNLAAIVHVEDRSKPAKVALRPALSITGKVTDPKGVGIPAARLAFWLGIRNMLTPFGSEIITDSQGRYGMRAVPPEQTGFEYRISVNSSGYGSKEIERISITGEPPTEVEMNALVLQPADQSISGVVVDAEGKPAARVPIFLHGIGQPIRNTATDNNGRFIIKRICKGPLRLQADFDSSPGGAGLIKAEGGDHNVKIILGQEGVHTKYISLTGKQLPHLKDFKIDPSSANTGNKMILVCFFDMNQRPSRHCITELAKQAEQFKEKAVITIAVQASKVDENALNKWVKENNIPFPVGIAEGDAEKVRFAWGVRSLPWLILTDRRHIVTAEGFGLDELDAQIGRSNESHSRRP
jgi:protocatechuate 3,4-dioxygenase beta subunit